MSDQPSPPSRSGKPAGWYKDPSGKYDFRYFDGRWTDGVANEGDDETYTDPVPSESPPRSADTESPPPSAAGAPSRLLAGIRRKLVPAARPSSCTSQPFAAAKNRGGCFKWFGIGIVAIIAIIVIAVVAGRGDDDGTDGDASEEQEPVSNRPDEKDDDKERTIGAALSCRATRPRSRQQLFSRRCTRSRPPATSSPT